MNYHLCLRGFIWLAVVTVPVLSKFMCVNQLSLSFKETILVIFCLFVCSFFCLFQTEPLAFLMQPKTILLGYLGQNLQINCSTNDENATVSLLHKRHSLTVFTKRKPEANKLLIQGEVFTLLNLDLSDGGMYSCEAKDQANNRIRWPRDTGYLILSQGKLRK